MLECLLKNEKCDQLESAVVTHEAGPVPWEWGEGIRIVIKPYGRVR